MASTDQFVIWTRYERPDGKIVRHAYGPYPTRAKAKSDLNKMVKSHQANYGLTGTEAVVTKLLS